MKILIIGFAKIKYMPYLNLYLDNIDAVKNDIHVMYWNRDSSTDKPLPADVTPHVFSEGLADEIPKAGKVKAFLSFAREAKKLIKREKFDFIIVLTSSPAVLLSSVLTVEYKNRYIYDYRDYTFEKFGVYRKIVARLVENSAMTVYSSEKHLQFLPESEKLHIAHNFVSASLNHRDAGLKEKPKTDEPVRFSYWGIIRNEELNKRVIDKLANDKRFEITFYGRKQQTALNLEKYCSENGIKNVRFTGEYQEEDRYSFAAQTDLLYNLYDVSGTEGMAMGNKFYDGIIFRIPQICTFGSFMGEKAQAMQVGKALNPDSPDFADEIYEYYRTLDEQQFKENCDKALQKIVEDNEKTAALLKSKCI